MSFLYEYQNMPYSDLIARSPRCDISDTKRDGRPYTQVSFRHPDFYSLDSNSFVLLFDDNDLLVERDCILKLSPPDHEPRVHEKQVFSDYRKYADSSREEIWFPYDAVYHLYVGDLSNGEHVESTSYHIAIEDIKFQCCHTRR